MILNCEKTSKIAAILSPKVKENIRNYIKSTLTDFCAKFYDQIYYDRWFCLNTIFKDNKFYKEKPLSAVYDYYINIGKTEKDAAIFALLDLNCLLEELFTESNRVFTKKTCDKNCYLPSYMLLSETLL